MITLTRPVATSGSTRASFAGCSTPITGESVSTATLPIAGRATVFEPPPDRYDPAGSEGSDFALCGSDRRCRLDACGRIVPCGHELSRFVGEGDGIADLP